MLNTQQIGWLYQLLDQINVKGESNKLMVLQIMEELRQMAKENKEEETDE